MPLSDLESIIAGFRSMQGGWSERTMPDEMRAEFEAWCERFLDDREASITRVSAGGVSADQIDATDGATARVVLYFHGGGYRLGSARSHRALAKRIALEARARVLVPDYRLAPEHVFPAAVEDAVDSYRWLLGTGVEPEQIAVGGDSAGAGLALALLVSLRDAGVPLPACAVLLSPFADLECRGESYATLAELDPIVSREMGSDARRHRAACARPASAAAAAATAAPLSGSGVAMMSWAVQVVLAGICGSFIGIETVLPARS